MKVKIKKNAYCWSYTEKLRQYLKNNEGNWIEVETAHLFTNQYNTKDFRLFDSHIEAVENDARIDKGKCKYCGAILNKGEVCRVHPECNKYGIEWFTPENTYFLKYPNGIKQIEIEFLSIHPLNIKIGSYYLENYPSLDYYRLYNGRQTINFKFDGTNYFVHNGIGFEQVKELPIPSKIQLDLRRKLYQLQEKYGKEF